MMRLFQLFWLVSLYQIIFAQDFEDIIDSYELVIAPHFDFCVTLSNVDPQIALDAIANGELIDDYALKMYFKCIGEKLGLFDEYGNIDWIFWKSVIGLTDPLQVNQAYETCKNSLGLDPNFRNYNLIKCVYDILPKIIDAQ